MIIIIKVVGSADNTSLWLAVLGPSWVGLAGSLPEEITPLAERLITLGGWKMLWEAVTTRLLFLNELPRALCH